MNEWTASRPLREAEQELMNGNRSYGNRNRAAYEREYGPYVGQMEGEIGLAEIEETN